MTLLGLTFAQLAAIFGAIGGAVTILYILKLRRRRLHVPFAKLWERVLQEKESTSLFRRLKRLLSLLLQLAVLLLLTGALGDPRLSEDILEGRQIILLLDTSASMKADDGRLGTRMATAIHEAKEIARGMGGADAMMIVRMDAQVTPLSAFTGDEKTLLKVLGKVRASDTAADLGRALKFCGDALRGRKNPLLILVGDGAYDKRVLASVVLDDSSGKQSHKAKPTPKSATAKKGKGGGKGKGKGKQQVATAELDRIDLRGIAVRFVPVGEPVHNIGIVAFSARRYPTNKLSFEVFLEIVHHGVVEPSDDPTGKTATVPGAKPPKPIDVDLQLLADGVLTEVQRLSLKPGERARFSCGQEERQTKKRWCEMAASGELLEARLVPAGSTGKRLKKGAAAPRVDAFALDDHAYALLPKRRKQKVLLVSDGNLFIEGALLLDDNISYSRIPAARYSKAALAGFDAVVFDSFYPKEPPGIDTLLFSPPADDKKKFRSPFPVKGLLAAPIITEQSRSHPVMRWITLKDVNISASATFTKQPGDKVLAASFRNPVIIARASGGVKEIAVGFNPRGSDLPLRVAFPIFVINAFHWFSGDSDALVTTYHTGQTWQVPLGSKNGQKEITVRSPDGRQLTAPVVDSMAILYGQQAGIYRLSTPEGELRIAANLADSDESRIKAHRELTMNNRRLRPPSGFGVALRREIWIYLLLLAVGVTLLEWLTYNRRITV